ncbi:hypothetical protein [Motilibacter aurantiacus]|uniref:hypothetical protein n=1 Tax=Motilibacter aurantiacus TaxID=2714955 RepID=UPI00140A5F38|nr:hypothetical protein [Motilibacter aurantiacus]NHC45814.1 hypothetical protein [Motilibacter aurantiacus]
MSTTTLLALPLAAEQIDESKITPGLTGFLLFALLGAALWLLIRSMNRHLGRVRFEEKADEAAQPKRPHGRATPGA